MAIAKAPLTAAERQRLAEEFITAQADWDSSIEVLRAAENVTREAAKRVENIRRAINEKGPDRMYVVGKDKYLLVKYSDYGEAYCNVIKPEPQA